MIKTDEWGNETHTIFVVSFRDIPLISCETIEQAESYRMSIVDHVIQYVERLKISRGKVHALDDIGSQEVLKKLMYYTDRIESIKNIQSEDDITIEEIELVSEIWRNPYE